MAVSSIKYGEAVQKISSALLAKNFKGVELAELDAAVSHWLMNGRSKVPFLNQHQQKAANEIIYAIFGEGKISDVLRETAEQLSFKIDFSDIPFPPVKDPKFTFIDLFAGVGGIRLGFQQLGGECVFSSEWDEAAKKTYSLNFGEYPYGDITKIGEKLIPDHDILLAGFPCQAFSIAGYRKGFDDEKGRGNLFFDVYRIIKEKRPRAFMLENVKNLEGHDKGNTFKVITEYLQNAGYSVVSKVLNTKDYGGIPQNRERIFIVGFRDEVNWEKVQNPTSTSRFEWPKKKTLRKTIKDLLEVDVNDYYYYNRYDCYKQLKEVATSRDTVYQWRRVYVRENKNGVCPTLTANMGTGGHNVPLVLDSKDIRKLTPRECFRLQGFPEKYEFPKKMANSHLYKQAGNSVSTPVVKAVAEQILKAMDL
mgnify:CR=1 FL=1